MISTVSRTACALAARRIGAIIVIERNVALGDMTEKGVTIDAVVSQDLLATIFFPNTALHDGAVIIGHNDRIPRQAGCCRSPTSPSALRHPSPGRHRHHRSDDAISIVVSEERGEVTLAQTATSPIP